MDRRKSLAGTGANMLFAVLFLLVCSLPLLGTFVPGLDRGPALNEKRELAALPRLSGTKLAELPDGLEAWFNDHFGFRGLLVRLHGLFHYRVFNISGSSQALPGRDGWLFYDGRGVRGGDPRRNHLARLPAEHQELFRALKEQFEYNDHYFAARGITYLVVVVPDKWSVYSEMLPRSVGPAAPRTSADLFLAYLRADTDLRILDLKQPLRRQRWADGPIYHQIDSHWNELGAYLAAGEMARFVHGVDARVELLSPEIPVVTRYRRHHGDLAALMGLEGWLSEDEPLVVTDGMPRLDVMNLPKPANTPNANRFPIKTHREGADLPRLLIMRDSYGDALLPWLSRCFSEVRWVWTSNYTHRNLQPLVDEFQPDIIIEEKAEKYLMFPIRYYTAPGRSAVAPRSSRKKHRQ